MRRDKLQGRWESIETSRGSHDKYVCSLSVDGGSKAFVSENWAMEDWIRDGERKIPE